MFRDAIYLDGKIVRSIESDEQLQLLDAPYVYRTIRVIDGHIERAIDEVDDLQRGFGAMFNHSLELTHKQLSEIVTTTLNRNLYLNRAANVEVRAYRKEGKTVLCVRTGELLNSDAYEAGIIRQAGKSIDSEIPIPQHFTSIMRQTISLQQRGVRQLFLLKHEGNIVSCEGFPLYGVVDGKIVAYTPWSSVESRRAEALFRKSNREVIEGVLNGSSESQPEEIFTLTTNTLISLSSIDGRSLVPFTAYSLGRTLERL